MKLYAVTKGEYSDYHIITLTHSKRKAEKIAKLCSDKYDDAVVEEYEESNIELRPLWEVRFFKSGNIEADELDYEAQLTFSESLNTVDHLDCTCRFRVYVEATDEEHALKIAEDLVAQYCYEHDLPIKYRRKYFRPAILHIQEIKQAMWYNAGDGMWMCSSCRIIVDWNRKNCCCDACGAVMDAVEFYEEVICGGKINLTRW